uniref:Uncharacterized protein n=1 Tax=Anguilla anguilla TaxID=7936 RepID=A0A0E9QEF5_ANGAN
MGNTEQPRIKWD